MNIWQDSNNADKTINSTTVRETLQSKFDKIDWKALFQTMDEIRKEDNKVVENQLGYWQIKHNWNPNIVTIVDSESNLVSASKETLDKIYGTLEEFQNEPKSTVSFKIIDIGDLRKDEDSKGDS